MLCLSSSCKQKSPPDIWEKEKMIEFLVDAQLLEAKVTTKELPKKQRDSLYARFYEELFAYHNTTQEIWQKNIEYYRDKPEEMDDIYKEVVLQLTLLESTVQHKQPNRDILERKDSLRIKGFKMR
jgi:superfamily II DNA or RNA helicase